jgi:transcription initiation factor IIF auxiliary subunit
MQWIHESIKVFFIERSAHHLVQYFQVFALNSYIKINEPINNEPSNQQLAYPLSTSNNRFASKL